MVIVAEVVGETWFVNDDPIAHMPRLMPFVQAKSSRLLFSVNKLSSWAVSLSVKSFVMRSAFVNSSEGL